MHFGGPEGGVLWVNCVPRQIQNDTECGPIWRPRLERGINGVMWLGPNPMGLVSL